jgi:hypothetical protein
VVLYPRIGTLFFICELGSVLAKEAFILLYVLSLSDPISSQTVTPKNDMLVL